jgi:hypothetical protein
MSKLWKRRKDDGMAKVILKFGPVLVVIVVFSTLIAGCTGGDPLLGNWEEPSSGVTMVIAKNGEITMSLHGASFKMTYEVQDPDILIFKATTDGTIPDQRMTYKVEDDRLILTLEGIDTVFYRVKK